MSDSKKHILESISNDGVGVLPTDTLYGLVGSAFSTEAVKRIYKLKDRDSKKPLIVLIPELKSIYEFDIEIGEEIKDFLDRVWPGKVSVILPCERKKFRYIHRGKGSIAFRVPDKTDLRKFLKKSGPLVAPSANIEGKDPAKEIETAREFFGDKVDFYKDEGKLISKPSTLIKIEDGEVEFLRKGSLDLENNFEIKK